MAPKSFEFQVPSFEFLLPSPNAKHETRDTKPTTQAIDPEGLTVRDHCFTVYKCGLVAVFKPAVTVDLRAGSFPAPAL
jgi:hypothetical protein